MNYRFYECNLIAIKINFKCGHKSRRSFWFSYRDVRVFFNSLASEQELQSEKERLKESKKGYILKFWLRIFLIGLVLLFLITLGNINIFGLILGLTTVVFTITISAFGVVWRYYFSRR